MCPATGEKWRLMNIGIEYQSPPDTFRWVYRLPKRVSMTFPDWVLVLFLVRCIL